MAKQDQASYSSLKMAENKPGPSKESQLANNDLQAEQPSKIGLIILGNSGVGKSFLANLFLKEEKFLYKSKPMAVTTKTEFEEYTIGDSTYVIFNIPGLIEAKQSQIDSNKQEIDKAFLECPNSFVIYVFGVNNGRIKNEDVIAFNALHQAYLFESESLIIVLNGIPSSNLREKDYEGETFILLRQLLDMKSFKNLCFLDTIDTKNEKEKQQFRLKLLPAVMNLTPKMHIKREDIRLQADEIKSLNNKYREVTERFNIERQQLEEEIQSAQKQHQSELQEQEQAFEHLKQEFAATDERQRKRGSLQSRSKELKHRSRSKNKALVRFVEWLAAKVLNYSVSNISSDEEVEEKPKKETSKK